MASLSRGISFRRQGSSGMSWTDTWSFNEEGVLVRMTKEEHLLQQQRFAGSSLSRIHDSQDDGGDDNGDGGPVDSEQTLADKRALSCSSFHTYPPLERSKSVGGAHVLPRKTTNTPRLFKWIKKALLKMKK